MPAIREADQKFGNILQKLPPTYAARVITAITKSYAHNPPPANFRMIVSPMVAWIWIGGVVAVFGALIALWPGAETRRRAVHSVYAAKLARELSRDNGWKLQIVKRRERAFKITGLTWIVERTFAWLGRNRRLSKDYEYAVQSSEAMIDVAAIRLMLNRLSAA